MTLEYTIRLARTVRSMPFKKRAPRAVREIKKMAVKLMKTNEVSIDNDLNKMIWSKGIRYLPIRMRLRFERKLKSNSTSANEYYTHVQYVECANFHNLKAEKILDA